MDRIGFTLIELLVVISIISLLMAITLPALSNAREQGKRVVCLSNMRNLTQGWIMYALDSDDKLCSARTDWANPPDNRWVADGRYIPGNTIGGTAQAIRNGVLWPYMSETLDVYKCPSDRSPRLRSYAIARHMNGSRRNSIIHPTYYRLSHIKPSSDRMVFVDALSLRPWIVWPFPMPRRVPFIGTIEWKLTSNCAITSRHSDGCNVSFADGHCEYYRYRDPRTVALGNTEQFRKRSSGDNKPDHVRFAEWAPQPTFTPTDPNDGETR